MKFGILRAKRELEMDVDMDVQDTAQNIDLDRDENNRIQSVTIYGTEKDGTLYYVVLSRELVDKIVFDFTTA